MNEQIKGVGVFCASAMGKHDKYRASVREFAAQLIKNDLPLIYGGGSAGLMGVLADAVLAGGGRAVGAIPDFLVEREVSHPNWTQLFITRTMHERKSKVYSLSEAFFALPGGFGTLDELCEVLTWSNLELHSKPVYLVNHHGFYTPLMRHFEHSFREGLLAENALKAIIEMPTAEDAVEHFLANRA